MDTPGLDLNSLAASMSVAEWVALILGSADESGRDRRVPSLPPENIQRVTNNRHGLKTLRGAAKFYPFIASEVRSRLPAAPAIRLLDFGCGWGRFARFFPQLTWEENIHGVDIDVRLIAACGEFLPRMNFLVIKPRELLPFADSAFDFVFSNSVFSHLNEDAHRFYIEEIARCTRPGGLLIATTLGPRKLRQMYMEEKGEPESAAQKIMTDESALAAGELVYRTGSRLPDYGLAFVPDGWTRTHWQPFFDVVDVNTGFSQDANVALRLR